MNDIVARARKLRPMIEQASVALDDKTASEGAELLPKMQYDGKLITAGTRINWNGVIKRAAVDVWDSEAYSPDRAASLWEDIAYRDGYRYIPETITAGTAFAKDECGWWKDVLYRSALENNVWTPENYPDAWMRVE